MKRVRLADVEPPRLLTEAEAAHLLGMSPETFSRQARELEAMGLPRRHPILRKRDRTAIHLWLDREFGIASRPEDRRAAVLDRIGRMGQEQPEHVARAD